MEWLLRVSLDTFALSYCFLLTLQKLDFHQLADYHARTANPVLLGFLEITDVKMEQAAYHHQR